MKLFTGLVLAVLMFMNVGCASWDKAYVIENTAEVATYIALVEMDGTVKDAEVIIDISNAVVDLLDGSSEVDLAAVNALIKKGLEKNFEGKKLAFANKAVDKISEVIVNHILKDPDWLGTQHMEVVILVTSAAKGSSSGAKFFISLQTQ